MAYYNGPPQFVDAQGRRVTLVPQYMQPVPVHPGMPMPAGAVRLVPTHPGVPIHPMPHQLVPIHIPPGHPMPQAYAPQHVQQHVQPHAHPHPNVMQLQLHPQAGPANPGTADAALAQIAAARQREIEAGAQDHRPPVDGERFVARYDERGNLFLVSADGNVLLEYPPFGGWADENEEAEMEKEERRRRRMEERRHRASRLTSKRAFREKEKELRAEYDDKVKGIKKRMSKARYLGKKMMKVLDKSSSDESSDDEDEDEEFDEGGDGAGEAEEREGTVVPSHGP